MNSVHTEIESSGLISTSICKKCDQVMLLTGTFYI